MFHVKHKMNSPIDQSILTPFLKCCDHHVTKENFDLLRDATNDFLITNPLPKDEEISRYYQSDAYISHTDAKRTLLDRVYQRVRSHTLKKKLKLVQSFALDQKTILDVGAGTGDFLQVCQAANWDVQGIEPNESARSIAENKLGNRLHTEFSDVGSSQFDVITLWHVLEHLPNLNAAVQQLEQWLKPNGTLILAVPNFNSYDANYYKSFWAAYDVPRHRWHFSQTAMRNLCNNFNLQVAEVLPMKFDAYYVSLLSEKYKTGFMNPLAAMLRGWLSNYKAKNTSEYSSLIYVVKKKI